MVSSLLVESLASPTQVLKDLYDARQNEGSSLSDFPKAVSTHFSEIFAKPEAFAEIPALDVSKPPSSFQPGALVRFRAMVQDTSASPAMYLAQTHSGHCAGWGIVHPEEEDGKDIDYSNLRDCTVVWAVSVPGESDWYKETRHGGGSGNADGDSPAVKGHKYPLPKQAHVGAQIKMYDAFGNNAPKTADVLDFVGILHSELYHSESEEESASDVLVPTLHVLFMRPHIHETPYQTAPSFDAMLRDELIAWIAEEALGGDREAAEWVLLTSIARVQSRTRGLLPPSLTLSRFGAAPDSTSIPTLVHILSHLHPLLAHLPLTLDYLNTTPFSPHSEAEDLHAGALQLPAGSTVLITEGGVREGKLLERGVRNIMAAQEAINAQTLAYQFPFSDFSFPVDLSFIVVSEGTKSAFVRTDLTIPLQPTKKDADLYRPASEIKLPPKEKLEAFRHLVTGAKTRSIELKDAVAQVVQDDFVEERKADKSVSPDDLKRTIMVARLEGLLLHEEELSIEIWKRAKELEKARPQSSIVLPIEAGNSSMMKKLRKRASRSPVKPPRASNPTTTLERADAEPSTDRVHPFPTSSIPLASSSTSSAAALITPPSTPGPTSMTAAKSQYRSRTMTLAMASASPNNAMEKTQPALPGYLRPASPAEQYWAARALTAETLLAAKTEHQRELKAAVYSEDVKRVRDLDALREQYNARNRQLEHILIGAAILIAVLIAILSYLLLSHAHTPKPAPARWALASHITIPILSPFASVIEHETSHGFGTRTIIALAAVGACLLYAIWWHWYARGMKRR
ncbi:unnamed protein product [Peniophora sp. CBMAI 1063]|nr:unnamed protein product [Peniophora sp. CBMAI 1063]